jgi:hypothetical protein
MNFKDLSDKNKQQLQSEMLSHAKSIGGEDIFLNMIRDVQAEGIELLSDRSTKFRFEGGNMSWNKYIYKDTFALFVEALDMQGDMFDGLKAKKQKSMLNMLKTLKPVIIRVKPKNMKDGEGFTLSIVETDIKDKATISLMFKIVFIYSEEVAREILKYKEGS